jgi:hypothetical protein
MNAITLVHEPNGVTVDTRAYPAYLASIRSQLPPGALSYAIADWHYDFRDPRSLHDAALEQLSILGGTLPEVAAPRGPNRVELTFLGSYRNGVMTFRYANVSRLEIVRTDQENEDFGDVIVDEVRLGGESTAIHEIVLEHATLTVEAQDFTHEWSPGDPGKRSDGT